MGGGFGLRIFLGVCSVVLFMLIVSGIVFFSLFGGYRDELDRAELRPAANVLSVEILRSLASVERRIELPSLIREQAEDAGLAALLLDQDGVVLEGFEPSDDLRGMKLEVTADEIRVEAERDGWLETKVMLGRDYQAMLARVLIPDPVRVPVSARGGARGVLDGGPVVLAVTFAVDDRLEVPEGLAVRLLASGLAGLGAAALLAVVLSRSLAGPLRGLTEVVTAFGANRSAARAAEQGPSQVRELAQAFNQMADRVSDNERAMRGLVADVSHELRTPLTSIRGFAQALLEGAVADESRRRHSVEIIEQESRRMLRMVEQLLDLSRLESGERRLELDAVEPSELLENAAALFGPRAEAAGLRLTVEVAPDAPTVEADYDRLMQVLGNLLDNALRHTTEGGIALRASRDAATGGLRIEAADTGAGIAAEHLPRLFDRFYQPPSRSGPGAGLGLAISREIMRAHGGEISAASVEGQGATITLIVPL